MERRKFIIGAGALATGSAAAVGTGAFSSVEANRDVNVDVTGDASAYLGLIPTSAYAQNPSGSSEIRLNFNDDSDPAGGGEGLNADGITTFNSVFEIQNQGDNSVRIGIDKSGLANPGRWHFVPKDEYDSEFYPNFDQGPGGLAIGTGNSTKISVQVDTTGIDDLAGGAITIHADSNENEGQ